MSRLSPDKIQYLARLGLARSQEHIGYYVSAMEDPYGTVTDSFRRNYAADTLDHILNIIADDPLIYDHIVSALSRGNPNRNPGRPWESVDQRLWGTDSLAHIYRRDTPGQTLNNTFGKIKKAIK